MDALCVCMSVCVYTVIYVAPGAEAAYVCPLICYSATNWLHCRKLDSGV